jgi:hypothetical protein
MNWLRGQKPGANYELSGIIMGIPFSRWGARPFVVYPIRYPEQTQDEMPDHTERKARHRPHSGNPIRTALRWQQMLSADGSLCMAEIARRAGVSRARVTQVMNLLALPREVTAYLASATDSDDLRPFSERRLRAILAAGNRSAQLSAFRRLRHRSACP